MRVFTHVLFALLALQLGLGLQVATAAVAYASSGPCPVHNEAPKSVDKHDCCKLSSNQCQCGNLALGLEAVIPGVAPALPFVAIALPARGTSAPVEGHFRPPIAF